MKLKCVPQGSILRPVFFLQCLSMICQANFSTAELIRMQMMHCYIWVLLCYLLVWIEYIVTFLPFKNVYDMSSLTANQGKSKYLF